MPTAASPTAAPSTAAPSTAAPALSAQTVSGGNPIKTETKAVDARSEASRIAPPRPGPSAAVNADLPADTTVSATAAGPDRAKFDQPAPKAPEKVATEAAKRGDDAIGGIMTRIGLAVRHKAASGEAPAVTADDPAIDTDSSVKDPPDTAPSDAAPSGTIGDSGQEATSPDSNAAATPRRGETIAEIMARVAEQVYSSHDAAARKAASQTAGSGIGTGQAGNSGFERVTDGPAEPQDLTPRASFA